MLSTMPGGAADTRVVTMPIPLRCCDTLIPKALEGLTQYGDGYNLHDHRAKLETYLQVVEGSIGGFAFG